MFIEGVTITVLTVRHWTSVTFQNLTRAKVCNPEEFQGGKDFNNW